jgi:hypothetical protein
MVKDPHAITVRHQQNEDMENIVTQTMMENLGEEEERVLVYFEDLGYVWKSKKSCLDSDILEQQLLQLGRNAAKQFGKFMIVISIVEFFMIGEGDAKEMQKTVFPIEFDSLDSTNFEFQTHDYRNKKSLPKKVKRIIKPLFKPDGKLIQLINNYTVLKNIEPVINLVELNNYRRNFKMICLPKIMDMSLKLSYQVIPTAKLPFSITKLLRLIKIGRRVFIFSSATLVVIKLIRLKGGLEVLPESNLPQPNQELLDYQKRRTRIRLIFMGILLTGSILLLTILVYYGFFDIQYLFEKEEYSPSEVGANDPVPELKRKFLAKLSRFIKNPEKKAELTEMSRGFEDYKQKYLDAILKM